MFTDPLRPFTSRFLLFLGILVGSAGLVLLIASFCGTRRSTAMTVAESNASPQLTPEGSTPLIISEFRWRGPNGVNDEFIEIYNNSGADHVVAPFAGTGYGIAASDGALRCTIPTGTIIPARGHFLCTNSIGYSLGSYPAGNGATATGDATHVTNIPDNVGIALFNNNVGGGLFSLNLRFDAVGPTTEANVIYREGFGLPVIGVNSIDYSFNRKLDQLTGLPVDSGNNAFDFYFADTAGSSIGAGQRLGAPGPQNLSSPIYYNNSFTVLPVDATKGVAVGPNRLRDLTPDIPNNSTFGTLAIRRRFVNQTGAALTRLRFRIIDQSTFPSPTGIADLRARTSGAVAIVGVNDAATCAATGAPATPPCNVTVQGTSIETPPSQPFGGGLNSSLSAGVITLGTPLANGASVNLQFLFGVQQNGLYSLRFELESLPAGGAIFQVTGNTSFNLGPSDALNPGADYDGDGRTDVSVFRPSDATWYLLRSQSGFLPFQWGLGSDRIVPADYDGDARTDIAVYRPSTGYWYIFNSASATLTQVQFGLVADLPTPGDYDGDGRADICLYRPSAGAWYRLNSSNGAFVPILFGLNGDKPMVADFDGDGRTDIAVYRPSDGTWYRVNSLNGSFTFVTFGAAADTPVHGDFDGDGRADLSVYRPGNGTWYRLNSSSGAYIALAFGLNTDIPVTGDYDFDGEDDISVFRPSNGTWYRIHSSNGALAAVAFGLTGDQPTPAALQY